MLEDLDDSRARGGGDGAKPIEHRARFENVGGGERSLVRKPSLSPPLDDFEIAGADQDQMLFGAGHGDVEDTEFLGERLLAESALDKHGGEGWVADHPLLVDDGYAQAGLTIGDDGAVRSRRG